MRRGYLAAYVGLFFYSGAFITLHATSERLLPAPPTGFGDGEIDPRAAMAEADGVSGSDRTHRIHRTHGTYGTYATYGTYMTHGTDPAELTDPTDLTDQANPADLTNPTDPAEPADSTDLGFTHLGSRDLFATLIPKPPPPPPTPRPPTPPTPIGQLTSGWRLAGLPTDGVAFFENNRTREEWTMQVGEKRAVKFGSASIDVRLAGVDEKEFSAFLTTDLPGADQTRTFTLFE